MKSIPQLSVADQERFWSNVDKEYNRYPALENPDLYSHVVGNCWEWKGLKDKDGYGMTSIPKKYVTRNTQSFRATRVAYKLGTGEDLGDKFACHHCDLPSCCNPDHIYPGTSKENVQDRERRLRSNHTAPYGENTGSAILTEKQVIQFFDDYNNTTATVASLAEDLGIGEEYAYAILAGNKWGYLGLHETRVMRSRLLKEDKIKEVYYRYWTEPVSQADLAREYGMDQTHVGQITRQFIWKEITDTVELPFKLAKRNGKLTDEQVIDIFIRYNADSSQCSAIAKDHNVSPGNVYLIGKRKTKRAVTEGIAI